MHNYFTLLNDLEETLSILRSLPVCIIVFNKNGEIIDINRAASKLLKINNVDAYTCRKLKLELDNQFYTITKNLQNKEKICDVKFRFKRPDNSFVDVNLNSTLLLGLKDMFIFQFSEIAPKKSI